MFPNDKNNKSEISIKNIMFKMLYYILIICLFAYFFYCIGKVPPINYVSKNTLLNNINISTSVGNFNSNDIPEDSIDPYEDELNTFITSAFNTRNDGFLSGEVSKLYDNLLTQYQLINFKQNNILNSIKDIIYEYY